MRSTAVTNRVFVIGSNQGGVVEHGRGDDMLEDKNQHQENRDREKTESQ